MHSLFTTSLGETKNSKGLTEREIFSLYYHDIFDFPLTFADLIKWNASENTHINSQKISVTSLSGYYFLSGREGLIYKRILGTRISAQKMEIAKKASKILSLIPNIKLIAVTGSLAMGNSKDESDIDILLITKKGYLWTSRAFAYILISLFNIQTRRFSDRDQKDKLCLNMWMDEGDLAWKPSDRNFYTAHELAQIVPLVNKDQAYEKLLFKNKWILKYWPNAVRISYLKFKNFSSRGNLIEKLAYKLQYYYMKKKMTREVVTPTRAFFHPQDWGRVVKLRLSP
jgi:D-beta-D-heptose 7-phosphate kinase/D-beta-D-heptose 1-phosphate adenosyltransferase